MLISFLTIVCLLSCDKSLECRVDEAETVPHNSDRRILFRSGTNLSAGSVIDGFLLTVFRADETGSPEYPPQYRDIVCSREGMYYSTGLFWPSEDPRYRFVAIGRTGPGSGLPGGIELRENGGRDEVRLSFTAEAEACADYVCAYCIGQIDELNCLCFRHMMTEVAGFTYTPPSGFSVSDFCGSYSHLAFMGNGISADVGPSGLLWNFNDVTYNPSYSSPVGFDTAKTVFPYRLTITVSYTLSKDGWSKSYSNEASVDLRKYAGDRITCNVVIPPPDEEEMKITVSSSEWTYIVQDYSDGWKLNTEI